MTGRYVVVGIGADGWRGLSDHARDELRGATVIYGSRRQLDLLTDGGPGRVRAELRPWRSPMSGHLAEVLGTDHPGVVHVVASGDPMFHGVGSSVVAAVGPERVRVIPAPSSVSLAAARLGWDLADTRVLSAVRAEPPVVVPALADGRRIIVLSRDGQTPAAVAAELVTHGFGESSMTVLEQLGGPAERITEAPARQWVGTATPPVPDPDPLNVIALDCAGPRGGSGAGLPDDAFDHDGQITKSPIRALTVAALQPGGRQVLWDIGSGSGSVAIEWLRADTDGRAVAFERDPDRAERLRHNARRHGVGDAVDVRGGVPDALAGAPRPDVVFVGGGLGDDILDRVWAVLPEGGRLVVNAVTLETQGLLARRHAELGGTLRRVALETAEPLGTMTTWRPSLPIVQWLVTKPGRGGAR